ncbi:MAG: GTPase ObgE [Actinomycetota bacterium]
MFVDEVRIVVSSGKGGDGAVSFHREKYRPNGGPDGGDGGRGGSVVLIAEQGLSSLGTLKDHPHQRAKSGSNGAKNNKTGADADDLKVHVPVGTAVMDEQGALLADLAAPGDRVVIAKAGRGGRGNAAFKTHARRAPGFGELGEPGVELRLKLEIRLVADVAVIGLPNAGKSTLVAALSAARPKVAGYAFTTLEPSLGVVELPGDETLEQGEERFTICDIPGLIEGAHEGKGLGLKFLKHAERAPVFVHMIDAKAEDPLEDFRVVTNELKEFREDLASRPQLVALNKIDVVEQGLIDRAVARFAEVRVDALPISGAERIGLEDLVRRLWAMVQQARAEQPPAAGFELFRTPQDQVHVGAQGDGWRLKGNRIERWVAMTDMSNPQAVSYLQTRLERAGVEEQLAAAGASHGDEVHIGPISFEWWPTGSDPDGETAPLPKGGGRRMAK